MNESDNVQRLIHAHCPFPIAHRYKVAKNVSVGPPCLYVIKYHWKDWNVANVFTNLDYKLFVWSVVYGPPLTTAFFAVWNPAQICRIMLNAHPTRLQKGRSL